MPAGFIERTHEGKASARIHDYLDDNHALTRAMFQRRSAGYRQMGYKVEMDDDRAERIPDLGLST